MYRLLVIDDEDDVRSAIARRLSRDGYLVDQAASQEEGISRINAAEPPYDLILTDMVMEDPHSGVKTLEAALSRERAAKRRWMESLLRRHAGFDGAAE